MKFSPRIIILRTFAGWTINLEWFPPGQAPSRQLPHHEIPPMKFLPGQLIPIQVSPWTTNEKEKCFQLSRFEFKIHFSEVSIATGDLSRGGIVNSFSVLAILYIFFNLV